MLAAPILALLALPLVQDTAKDAPSAAPTANEAWKELDRVVVIVNEDIFTYRALQAQLVRLKNRMGLEGKDALQEAQSEILTAGVRERLWIQAGLDLGVEPAHVQRMVRDHLDRLQDRFGGVVGLSEYFKSLDLDSNQAKEKLQEDVYKDVFDNYITGDNPTAIGRPNRDTYVRPGLCRFQFRNVLSSRRELAQIGGKPQEVVLQFLILDPRHFSDLEAGRVLAEQLRERIVDGEDMGQLNEQYGGMKRNGGVTDPLDETRLAQVDSTLAAFLRDAVPGDLSAVIEYRNESVSTWRLVRVVDRTPGQIPELTSPEVQEALIKLLEDGRREYRRDFAFKRLVKASYVWPAELAGGERPNGN